MAVLRTSLATILSQIKRRLTSSLVLPGGDDLIPAECVIISIRKKVPHLQADHDIVLRPRRFRVVKETTDQTGRIDTRISRRIEVRCRTRLALDDPSRDEHFLLDESLGHIAFEEGVCDVLQDYDLLDPYGAEDAIAMPMLLDEGEDTQADTETSQGGNWGETSLYFIVEYTLANSDYPT